MYCIESIFTIIWERRLKFSPPPHISLKKSVACMPKENFQIIIFTLNKLIMLSFVFFCSVLTKNSFLGDFFFLWRRRAEHSLWNEEPWCISVKAIDDIGLLVVEFFFLSATPDFPLRFEVAYHGGSFVLLKIKFNLFILLLCHKIDLSREVCYN